MQADDRLLSDASHSGRRSTEKARKDMSQSIHQSIHQQVHSRHQQLLRRICICWCHTVLSRILPCDERNRSTPTRALQRRERSGKERMCEVQLAKIASGLPVNRSAGECSQAGFQITMWLCVAERSKNTALLPGTGKGPRRASLPWRCYSTRRRCIHGTLR